MQATISSVSIPDELQSQLDPGESLLWHGRPRQGLLLRAGDAFLIPFSLVWCAIMLRNLGMERHYGLQLHMLIFVLPGLYILVGRFLIDAWLRARTSYAVSSQRVIIVSGVFTRTVRSIGLRTLSELTLSERKSGAGTIVFGPQESAMQFAGTGMGGRGRQAPRFELRAQTRDVYMLIREAQRRLGGPGAS